MIPQKDRKIILENGSEYAILPGIGGQTGLNLAMQLESKGVLKECSTELLGTKHESIEKAEDREKFKELCLSLGEPVLPSEIANSEDEGYEVAKKSATPLCSALRSPWAVQAAALPKMKKNCHSF